MPVLTSRCSLLTKRPFMLYSKPRKINASHALQRLGKQGKPSSSRRLSPFRCLIWVYFCTLFRLRMITNPCRRSNQSIEKELSLCQKKGCQRFLWAKSRLKKWIGAKLCFRKLPLAKTSNEEGHLSGHIQTSTWQKFWSKLLASASQYLLTGSLFTRSKNFRVISLTLLTGTLARFASKKSSKCCRRNFQSCLASSIARFSCTMNNVACFTQLSLTKTATKEWWNKGRLALNENSSSSVVKWRSSQTQRQSLDTHTLRKQFSTSINLTWKFKTKTNYRFQSYTARVTHSFLSLVRRWSEPDYQPSARLTRKSITLLRPKSLKTLHLWWWWMKTQSEFGLSEFYSCRTKLAVRLHKKT